MMTHTKIADVLRDLHIDTDNDDELCPWCDQPVTDDDAADHCHRRGQQMHTTCHGRGEAECRCPA